MAADLSATDAELLGKAINKVLGASAVDIEDAQVLHAFCQQCMGHCRARTTGAHLHHALARYVVQVAPKTFGEPQAVGVMTDAFAALEHHGVDRTYTPGLIGELIEQRQNRLLARVSNVQTGEVHQLGGP